MNAYNSFPIELHADNSSVLLLYQKNLGLTYLRQFKSGNLSSEIALPMNYVKLNPYIGGANTPTLCATPNYAIYGNSLTAYVFGGKTGGTTYYFEIDKASLAVTTATLLPIHKINYVNYVEEIDTNKVVVCGSNYQNYESLALFDRTTKDTLWTNILSSVKNTQIVKSVTDPQNTFIYTLSLNSGNIAVRKIAANNSKLKWTYIYANPGGQSNFPTDINYDTFKNKLSVAGFQTINTKKEGTIIQIDTSGVATDTIIKKGSHIGDNEVLCVETLNDGSVWAGGYINDSSAVKGFISELTTPIATSVWPGDANSDGVADNLDILELGLHYKQTGTPRANTSNLWQGNYSANWTGTITNGKNVNHSNCNGDGIINDDDTLAIFNNYNLNHAFKPLQTTTNPALTIMPDQNSVAKGTWGTASIYVGDVSFPISNINGIAYTVNYDNTLLETDSVWIEYPTSFINASDQNLKFRKHAFANGKLYTATTHTNNANVSGYGKIATLHYKINPTLATDNGLNLSV